MTVFCRCSLLGGRGAPRRSPTPASRPCATSRAGKTVSTVTDPAAPGFEAFLEPTPTLAAHAQRRGDACVDRGARPELGRRRRLRAARVPGSLRAHARTMPSASSASPGSPAIPSAVAAAAAGAARLRHHGGRRWSTRRGGRSWSRRWPRSSSTTRRRRDLPRRSARPHADQVGPYLAAVDEGESPQLARCIRQRAFYRAWMDAVAASSDPAAVPGELESGIGRFVRGLAGGPAPGRDGAGHGGATIDGGVRYDVDRGRDGARWSPSWCRSRPPVGPAGGCGCGCSTAPATRARAATSPHWSCRPTPRSSWWATPTPSTTTDDRDPVPQPRR